MTLVPRRYCLDCDTLLMAGGTCIVCDRCKAVHPLTHQRCVGPDDHPCKHCDKDSNEWETGVAVATATLPPCPATNAAGDVCSITPPHRCPHRAADGRDFGAEQSDAEIGALVRAKLDWYHEQPGSSVDLEAVTSVERVDIAGVNGPGVLTLKVRFSSKEKRKGGEG